MVNAKNPIPESQMIANVKIAIGGGINEPRDALLTNLEALEAHGVDGYVAPGRAKHPTAANGKIGGPQTQRMRKKIDDGGFETLYRLRKQVVEPVFGQIKQARGFRQFLLRGIEKVRAEWAMICTAHNLLKLFTLAKAA
jgi:hypothetical protein